MPNSQSPPVPSTPSHPVPGIVARDLVLMRGDKVALQASDFTIPCGSITAIIGPNGGGKSTLLHAIAGLLEPTAGTLTVLGATAKVSRPRVSYVLQYTAFPPGTPLTVREAVAMARYPGLGFLGRPSKADRARVEEALERLRITDLADRHLHELSGGQRQRVYVAQGIAQDHDMLLLDEPLTGLDITSAKTIDDIMHDEPHRGCSVVITTHDLDEARAADHVILVASRAIASGSPGVVLTAANLATAYGFGSLHEHSAPEDAGRVHDVHDHHHEGH